MGKGSQQRRRAQRRGGDAATAESKFAALTPEYEDAVFTHGSARDAAVFTEVMKKITRYLGTQPWKEVSVLIRAIEQLEEPEIRKPEEPKREYWTDGTKTAKTSEVTDAQGQILQAVEPDQVFAARFSMYVEDRKTWKAESSAWTENKTRA